MPLFIDVIASENSNLLRNALTTPPTDAAVVGAFRYVERGIMGDPPRSRTAVTGKWIGVPAIIRADDGSVASAQLTWEITDAQMAALGLTDQSKINAFAQKLVDDVKTSLVQRAARNRGGQMVGFWEVASVLRSTTPVGPGVISVPARDVPTETSYWPLVGAAVLVGTAVYFLGKK